MFSCASHLLPRGAVLAGVQGPHGLVGEVDVAQPLPELVREVFARVLAEEAPHLETDETRSETGKLGKCGSGMKITFYSHSVILSLHVKLQQGR